MTLIVVSLIVGFALGFGAAFLLRVIQSRSARQIAEELIKETEDQRRQQVEQVIESVKNAFGSLSLDALKKANEQLTELAKEKLITQTQAGSKELESKKALIDQQLKTMTVELEKVGLLMKTLENDRAQKFGQLDKQLQEAVKQTNQLMQTTQQLKEALASSKVRGQWGERMAEDVLRIAGFVENINYRKQMTAPSTGKRPDYTFFLPRNLVVNMDVKFPLENYLHYLECESKGDALGRENYRKKFLSDVKNRIKEVAGREYINPSDNTVDYVLLFIPNEQIYAFIHEQDRGILDEGLKQHVVFCSPVTLFAVLAVIRQAVENFSLEQTAHQILRLYGEFNKQWKKFADVMEKVGNHLQKSQDAFNEMVGTRKKALEKPLNEIEDLRRREELTSGVIADLPPEDNL
jgi:DNA recombination protein RmuC